jgi:hypothetical protein
LILNRLGELMDTRTIAFIAFTIVVVLVVVVFIV